MIESDKSAGVMYRSADVGGAILGAGRPFLVLPAVVKALTADHVMIGWKDTREARRAVQDALPFLHEAKRVTVLEICEKEQMETARHHVDDVVRYLDQHRIKAEPRVEIQARGSRADQIVGWADDEDADLLVTGAYGHSRLNEWMFGGMTRDLLTTSPICCLMSH
jgi:nucleotide-binding universal stress UspA family protein